MKICNSLRHLPSTHNEHQIAPSKIFNQPITDLSSTTINLFLAQRQKSQKTSRTAEFSSHSLPRADRKPHRETQTSPHGGTPTLTLTIPSTLSRSRVRVRARACGNLSEGRRERKRAQASDRRLTGGAGA